MVDRRTVVKGLSCLPLAGVLADPMLAAAEAAALTPVSLTLDDGHAVAAALALPAVMPAPAVLLIHEWWGLNDQIKTMAAELAREGYVALAVDLMGGKVATTPEQAKAQIAAVDQAVAARTLADWLAWLRGQPACNGKIATMGWCFGGGWSLRASLATPVDATVIYYGQVTQKAAELAALKGPVLGHFADRDQYINPAMVGRFLFEMKEARKPIEQYTYDADHAFANPTGQNYHREDAQLAWKRTLEFLNRTLRS